jgi:GTP-binding protein
MAVMSAKTGFGVTEVLDHAKELMVEARRRVSTGELNRVIRKATEARTPSARGQMVRLRYVTQADTVPPTFVLFAKNERMIGKEYLRYLENRLRESQGFHSVPLRFVVRHDQDAPEEAFP